MKVASMEQYQKFSAAMHMIYKRLYSLHQDLDSVFPEDITNSELNVLSFVRTHPGAFLKEISQSLNLPGSTLTSVVDRLECRRLVHRMVSERNRRSYSLELTEDGMRISALHEDVEKKMWESMLGALDSDTDREKLINLLETISHGL
ncbi:MarR family winged helix-turn-helix transcriptional regulator [Acetobacterium tundrae]|uniref:MarR family transcriptional regulator n=1 Tax=Acetobacterium tundrae TaxID=132932 RepID=A0ABR6WPI9_9FIRM|nr:MarR family transcriptional regulator [Acetobacterium tundrae]MBC3798216.1 MarR family transcriptional regulator [Acetobacterium tundrae]